MPTEGTAGANVHTHQDLMTLMAKLERLKATSDLLEKEIDTDMGVLKEKWDIVDIEVALESIDSIAASADEHAKARDKALTEAGKILEAFEDE